MSVNRAMVLKPLLPSVESLSPIAGLSETQAPPLPNASTSSATLDVPERETTRESESETVTTSTLRPNGPLGWVFLVRERMRSVNVNDKWIRIGFLFSCVQMIVGVTLLCAILALHDLMEKDLQLHVNQQGEDESDWLLVQVTAKALKLYHSIYMASSLFQFWLFADSMAAYNTMQLLAFFVFQVISALYAVMNVVQESTLNNAIHVNLPTYVPGAKEDVHKVLGIVLIATSCLATLLWGVVGTKVYHSIGWRMFERTGADLKRRRRLIWHHLFLLFLKLDVFFYLGFALQYIVLIIFNPFRATLATGTYGGYTIAIVGVPTVVLASGFYAINRQSIHLLTLFSVGSVLGLVLLAAILFSVLGFGFDDVAKEYSGSQVGLVIFVAGTFAFALATLVIGGVNGWYISAGNAILSQRRDARVRKGGRREDGATDGGKWDLE
ncbi:hypothetical protein M427DRAFT_153048 [Gonapodya prolifera JEL478]|uniref:Uncharacterized protein n=1 Tax=Gonapodya prolifera (strain JEL478) TaxID=1344416 RepID=A0A139APM0_GONPJ|nr:hypothetical protein M427DRAFT_153048 [Gonapodya prolifera JEL478]|eukprot:KXS18672.1 hypothetical protein M427DRAFT_153048 [Gonapodya prolifera JEL478]